jgi:FKBP-type peptidyl-prolyl cis-trans isomerase FkpA
MRKLMIIVFVALFAVWGCSPEPPKTEEQQAFYVLGTEINKTVAVFGLTAEELKYVQQGFSDAAAGKKLVVEPNEAQMKKINDLAQARMTKATEKNKTNAKPFLEKAAAEQGAKKTASGVIYKEIKAGTGIQAKPTDVVKVHYVGTFIDGKEFDNSVKRGQPLEIPLGQIIPCWMEGIGMMKVGGKAKLICPSDTAYGDRGRPPIIAGGSTLIFDVELLDAKPFVPPQMQAPQGPNTAPAHTHTTAPAPKPAARK